MIKVSHEVPRALMELSRSFNDYDYALVHKFKEDPEYFNFFKESLHMGREVYLDNSLFELGTMFDHKEFAKYVRELGSINPEKFYYIVPDAFDDSDKTINSFKEFISTYPDLPGHIIGVPQGSTFQDFEKCYQFMEENADMVAIGFKFKVYLKENPDLDPFDAIVKGRRDMINYLGSTYNSPKPHHLLGCSLPQEFKAYNPSKPEYISPKINIKSIDTSNPIVMGISGWRYDNDGLETKDTTKLIDLFEVDLTNEMLDNIGHNIKMFRDFCGGTK